MKGGCPDPECRKWWVSTRTYTAVCLNGKAGSSVTITRQARSFISQEDADWKAARLAKCEAEAEIRCYFEASQGWMTSCSAIQPPLLVTKTARSEISKEDAMVKALIAAQKGAANLCQFGFEGGNIPIFSMAGIPLFAMGGQQITTEA